jgi:trans-aconitate methyltransferase
MSLPASYFDDLYGASEDPWGFRDRWYEQRKRALTLALLPEPRYATAYEPGCSIGVLTQELAERCDRLLATDLAASAVSAARLRCAHLPHVRVDQASVSDWPEGPFDLVVLSELVYYLSAEEAAALARTAMRTPTVLAVHWRHPVADYPMTGDQADTILHAAADAHGKARLTHYEDADLVASVWCDDPRSVAARGGLS